MIEVVVVIIGLFAFAAVCGCFLLWKKNRALFGWADNEIRILRNRISDTSAELAKQQALLDLVATNANSDHAIPLPRFASQHGEDAWLYQFFKSKIQAGETGFYIEAGAHNGELLSNTLFLEDLGWAGLLVEADPELAAECKLARPNSFVEHVALGPSGSDGFVEFNCADLLGHVDGDSQHRQRVEASGFDSKVVRVPQRSLNELLEGRTEHVDILSLDLEGAELSALDGFDIEKYQPKIAIIEANHEAHARALKQWFTKKNYRLETTLGANLLFVPS